MKLNYIFFYFLLLISLDTLLAFNQSNIADQDFIDNADQFSNENGVRIYTDDSANQSNNAQFILESKPQESTLGSQKEFSKSDTELGFSKVVKKQSKQSLGFSFSQMAKSSKKVDTPKSSKKVGFSFFDMAEKTKKVPTPNATDNVENSR